MDPVILKSLDGTLQLYEQSLKESKGAKASSLFENEVRCTRKPNVIPYTTRHTNNSKLIQSNSILPIFVHPRRKRRDATKNLHKMGQQVPVKKKRANCWPVPRFAKWTSLTYSAWVVVGPKFTPRKRKNARASIAKRANRTKPYQNSKGNLFSVSQF